MLQEDEWLEIDVLAAPPGGCNYRPLEDKFFLSAALLPIIVL